MTPSSYVFFLISLVFSNRLTRYTTLPFTEAIINWTWACDRLSEIEENVKRDGHAHEISHNV